MMLVCLTLRIDLALPDAGSCRKLPQQPVAHLDRWR